jgi:TonB family protein
MDESKEIELYLRIDGVEHGPLTVEEVKAWVDEGKFRRTDYIRMAGKKAWVKAENLVHLKALFEEAREKRERGAFASWLTNVREGKPPMVLTPVARAEEEKRIAEERETLAAERAALEEQEKELREQLEKTIAEREDELRRLEAEREDARKRLEAERDEEVKRLAAERDAERQRLIAQYEKEVEEAKKERDGEVSRLASERERLDDQRARLADEERELAAMGKAMKRRRRLPFFVAGAVVLLAILIGAPSYYFFIYKPGREIAAKLARISDLERKIDDLTKQYEVALAAGDEAKAEEIAKEIEKARKEKERLAEEVPEERMPTSRGQAKLAGLLRAEGGGAEDPARSGGAITAGLSGAMGGVRATYSRELGRTPGLEGHVIVRIRVAADGTVTGANVVSSTIGNSAVESAVTAAARRARFRPAAGATVLTYKFDFSP